MLLPVSVTNCKDGETFLSGKVITIPLLQRGQKKEQRYEEKGNVIRDGEYNLTFVIESKNEKHIVKTN